MLSFLIAAAWITLSLIICRILGMNSEVERRIQDEKKNPK